MGESTQTKVCVTCGISKPLEEFHRSKQRPDGRVGDCKPCRKTYAAARRRILDSPERRAAAAKRTRERRAALSPEQLDQLRSRNAAWMRRWYSQNPEEARARQRRGREANPERYRQYARDYRVRYPDRKRDMDAAYREKNADRLREQKARWYEANAEMLRRRAADWLKRNPQKAAEYRSRRRARVAGGEVTPTDLEALWNGTCYLCGDSIDRDIRWPSPDSPSVDHIRPLSRGGSHSPDNCAWSHLRCNLRKGVRLPD